MDDGQGNVNGIKTMKVEWTKDEAGRWNMADVPGNTAVVRNGCVLQRCILCMYLRVCLNVHVLCLCVG